MWKISELCHNPTVFVALLEEVLYERVELIFLDRQPHICHQALKEMQVM